MRLLKNIAVLIAVLLIVGCEANGEESSEVIYQSVAAVQVYVSSPG